MKHVPSVNCLLSWACLVNCVHARLGFLISITNAFLNEFLVKLHATNYPWIKRFTSFSLFYYIFVLSYLSFSDQGSAHGELAVVSCWQPRRPPHRAHPVLCTTSEWSPDVAAHPVAGLKWKLQSASRHEHTPCSEMRHKPRHPISTADTRINKIFRFKGMGGGSGGVARPFSPQI